MQRDSSCWPFISGKPKPDMLVLKLDGSISPGVCTVDSEGLTV